MTGTAVASLSLGGCTGVLGGDGDSEPVVLGTPKNWKRRKDLDLPYPTYGEKLPSATVPAPLHDEMVDTRGFVGDRHTMLTFIYTSCVTVCPGLTTALRHVQADAIKNGYADRFAFLPMTFDPEYDTPDQLRTYGDDLGVDFSADNWYFLRPETPARAQAVVTDTFGIAYEQGDGMGDRRHFTHSSLVLLVNEDGYVERAYNGDPPGAATVVEDANTLRERW